MSAPQFDLTVSVRIRVTAQTMSKARLRAVAPFDELKRALPPGCVMIGDAKTAFIREVKS